MQEQEEKIQIERDNQEESGVNMRAFFAACRKNWYWFVLSLIAFTALSVVVAKSLTQQYSATAYILIKSDKNSGVSGEMQLFADLGLGNKADDVFNEMYVIKSTGIIESVIKDLGIACRYYSKPMLRRENIYKDSPIELTALSEAPKAGYEVEVIPLSDTEFSYRVTGADDESWTTAKYGAKLTTTITDKNPKTPDTHSFSIARTAKFAAGSINKKVIVKVLNPHQLAITISQNLEVKLPEKYTLVLKLDLKGDNFEMVCDILNGIIASYNQDVINDKNRVALSTEKFILDRIAALSGDLGGIDTQIESLKIRNNIPDLSSAAGQLVDQGTRYKDAVAEVEMQLMLANYIKDHLAKMKRFELIPANTGISDMGVESLINTYNEECLKYEKIASSSGSSNPVLADYEKSLTSMQDNINSSISNFLKTLQIKLEQAKLQERRSNSLITSVPTQEKELNVVLRQQKIKEELYLYLLNKREENALQLAITEPNAKIVEHAGGEDLPVFPLTMHFLLLGVALGLLVPFGIIYLVFWIYSLDTKVHCRKDIEDICDIPIVGELPCKRKDQQAEEIIVTETGRDRITEAMRIIRGNLGYMAKWKPGEGVVVQMTSTMPGEGKSYVTINLALSCAHAGKRVVALDLDLRKGNFSKYVSSHPGGVGVGAYLSGNVANIDDIIVRGSFHKNLDTILAGALPPNPSYLLMSERFQEMIAELRRRYDIIFLDTVPFTVIADAAIVQRVADVTIYVVRDGMVDKNYIAEIDRMNRNNRFKNLAFLLTDVNIDSHRYSYGNQYGYNYGYGYDDEKPKKKRFFFF